MKRNILFLFFIFSAFIFTDGLKADDNLNNIVKDLKTSNTVSANYNNFNNEVLLARRSGGRSGSRGFSSRRSSSRSYSRSSSSRSYGSGRSYGRSSNTFVYVGGGSRYHHGRSSGGSGSFLGLIIFVLIIIGLIYFFRSRSSSGGGYTSANDAYGVANEVFNTIKLQFALHSTAEDFEREVKKLAEELDYDNEEDLKTLVNETAMMLIQNQDYIRYAYVKQGKPTRNIDVAERDFDNFINEETAKFSQITFQNRGGKVRERELSDENKPDFMEIDEYFIISLIVSYANTEIKLKEDNYSWAEYDELLRKVASIPTNNLVAAEIIWTPDAEGDVLTEDDIITHYPYMIQL